MAALKWRKKVLLAKIETTYGTDPTPTGAANAILVSNLNITPFSSTPIERDTVQPHLGSRQQIHTGTHVMVEFEVEVAGSGAAGTAPKFGPLLRGCAHAETVNASVSVVYEPVSASEESVTLYFHHDGHLHKVLGARGTMTMNMAAKQIPKFAFRFLGLYVEPTATADATPTLSGFQVPLSVGKDNTPTFSLHSFSGKLQSFSLEQGSSVVHRELVGEESVQITDRRSVGNILIEEPAIGTKNFYAAAAAETLAALQIIHGTVAGNIVTVAGTNVQVLTPAKQEMDSLSMLAMGLNFVPSASGDDEYSITLT